MFLKIDVSALICSFEKSMITHAASVLKDTFEPRFASIQAILEYVHFWGNYEVIPFNFQVLASIRLYIFELILRYIHFL